MNEGDVLPWMKKATLPWQKVGVSYKTEIDLSIFSTETVFKTCYLFLDQCYLFVTPTLDGKVEIYFSPLEQSDDMRSVVGEFSNRLLWQETRSKVSDETKVIRELIVAQALAEIHPSENHTTEADYNADPLKISE